MLCVTMLNHLKMAAYMSTQNLFDIEEDNPLYRDIFLWTDVVVKQATVGRFSIGPLLRH